MDLKKEIKLSDLIPKRSPGARKPKSDRPRKKRGHAPSEIVGLKIGATGIRAALVVNNGGKRLVRTAYWALPSGVVDGGEVRDPSALGEALSSLFASSGLPRKSVRLGLANSRVGVRVIEVAGVDDDKQLENAISFRAHEMLSVPVEEAVIDYQVLSSDVDETGTLIRKVLVVVAYRDSVERYLTATDVAKLDLTGIDFEAFALLRAVSSPSTETPERDGEQRPALVAVSVGHERSTLAISDGQVCQFARVLEWGGADVGSAIARALKIGLDEGEDLKHGLSLVSGREGVEGLPYESAKEVVGAVRYELQNLVRELLSSLRFYQSQPDSLPIGEILVAGGTSAIPGFAEDLGRELGIPVRLADPFARVQLGEGVERPERPGALAIAIGLGVED
ncbi:MAG TPA: type IV pilus assembly protein PilM [Gaiellaceae bacterium]|nr:type IV pilus assembly protein PilM [Gaiellaceae bacterium]